MKKNLATIFVYTLLLLWSLVVIAPLFWLVTTSIKDKNDVFLGPKFIPWVDFIPTGQWWVRLFTVEKDAVLYPYLNSLIVAGVSAFLTTILGAMAAYALTRVQFKFGPMKNEDIQFWIVSQRFMPPIVSVFAIFVMYRVTRLLDTHIGLILVYTVFNLPLAVWLMSNFFAQIPRSVEEAAWVDGASLLTTLFRVVVPMVLPSLVATFLFCFVFAWNEFLFALILSYSRTQTVPLLIASQHFQRGPQWWDISALSTLAVLPPIVITIALQKYFVKGLIPIGK
ncbi:MAG: carbohydrate ABC transporter permease [Candidatus Bipolaricaulota bacterium]|nr:carbohydrate ABC transporter permease [Candidatus Bipolaricaulota bacterium]MDW8127155.1 carbohydrate ABC transporter permease [Candidatus Bipolaricaulota bacterium]